MDTRDFTSRAPKGISMIGGSKSDDDDRLETQCGSIRHRHHRVPKGIQMLRLERELKPILDKWREAMKHDPKAWK